MKITLIILSLLVVAFIVLFFVLGLVSRSGAAPGLADGRLAKCPARPNCVVSEYEADGEHYIEPLEIPEDATADPLGRVGTALEAMGGTLGARSDGYLAATFSSRIFGFVDDMEVRVDPGSGVIHVRSASRVGYGDGGVNRKRVEALKRRLLK